MVKVSIVIPTYKRPEMLVRLLESLTLQSRMPDEVIIVDDGSDMDALYRQHIDPYVHVFRKIDFVSMVNNSGAPVARNVGIEKATGDWIALVDDDDEWLPEKLEKQLQCVEKTRFNNLGFVYCWTYVKNEIDEIIEHSQATISGQVITSLLRRNCILAPSVLLSRSAWRAIGGFDPRLHSCQDWDSWIRIALCRFDFDYVPEFLAVYRKHANGSIGSSSKAAQGYTQVLKKHWLNIIKYTPVENWISKFRLYCKMKWVARER